jgi:hypothetical protein
MSTERVEVPTMLIEIVNQQDSGFVRDDTAGTPYEERIKTAGVLFVPNIGNMAEPILDSKGEKTGRTKNVKIRYIKGCPYIKVEEQEKLNYKPNEISSEDQIAIKKGSSIIKKEGDTALYDYLENVYYNLNAPNRPNKAKALFKVVQVDRKNEQLNEHIFIKADAIKLIESLVLKNANKGYKYKEEKIDSLLSALAEFGGETYAEKINTLTRIADKTPKKLLDIANKMENVLLTEISHALELSVIKFSGNTVEYVDGKSVLASLGTEKLSQDKKIGALADLLITPEYSQAYVELKAKIDLAKENQLK